MDDTEHDLESFRRQWRDEVSSRNKAGRRLSAGDLARVIRPADRSIAGKRKVAPSKPAFQEGQGQGQAEYDPLTYHDLEDREEYMTLGKQHLRPKFAAEEPHSALEHYEKAVEKESAGRLGDSVDLYRQAYKLDSGVHETYRQKHFPASSFSSKTTTSAKSNPPEHAPLRDIQATDATQVPIADLIESFGTLSIPPAPPPTDLSPPHPCPIAFLPEEIIVAVFNATAVLDVASFTRLAQVCKRFAYLVATEDSIWKRVTLGSEFGFANMPYRYTCDLRWKTRIPSRLDPSLSESISPAPPDLTSSQFSDYLSQFRHRPRIRFNGCYISTVNYTRPGASHQSKFSWSSPVHIVTYYRYLRFFPDGTAIKLLTTSEPIDVVHHIKKENVDSHHSQALPSSVMNNALKGRWRLTGPGSKSRHDIDETDQGPGFYFKEPSDDPEFEIPETEGMLHVETQGVTPKYMWKMQFAIGSAGRKTGTRNNKLSWKGFWSYNKLTDDWGEFGLKNDKPFYFSRVKSYGIIQ